MNYNPTTLSVDEQIDKQIISTGQYSLDDKIKIVIANIRNNAPNGITQIKSLIRQVVTEIIGEDEPRGKYNVDSLLERDVIIRNGIFSEQRTKLNNLLKESENK